MVDFIDKSIDDMNEDELRSVLRAQMVRNELLVRQNKFTLFRYDIVKDIMSILFVTPEGEVRPGYFPNYSKDVPNVILDEKEHKRLLETLQRIVEDPSAPKVGAVAFTYKDGRRISAEYKCIYDETGRLTTFVGQHVDMYHTHERMMSTIESLTNRKQLADSMMNSYDSIILVDLTDMSFQIVRASQGVRAISGQVGNVLELAKIYRDFYVSKDEHAVFDNFINVPTLAERLAGVKSISCDYRSSNIGWCHLRIAPLHYDTNGKLTQVMLTVESTESWHSTKPLHSLTLMDGLTGLLNRTTGEATIKKALKIKHRSLYMLIDCDYFSAINTMLGQPVGDMLLIEVAKVLKNVFPKDIVVRSENDEFQVYASNADVLGKAEAFAEVCFKHLQKSISHIDIPEMQGITTSITAGMVSISGHNPVAFDEVYALGQKHLRKARKKGGASFSHAEI